tara:strand:+ start:656 stop:1594 length:939 start_codon:yes stop_codon:yes gene_type:complete
MRSRKRTKIITLSQTNNKRKKKSHYKKLKQRSNRRKVKQKYYKNKRKLRQEDYAPPAAKQIMPSYVCKKFGLVKPKGPRNAEKDEADKKILRKLQLQFHADKKTPEDQKRDSRKAAEEFTELQNCWAAGFRPGKKPASFFDCKVDSDCFSKNLNKCNKGVCVEEFAHSDFFSTYQKPRFPKRYPRTNEKSKRRKEYEEREARKASESRKRKRDVDESESEKKRARTDGLPKVLKFSKWNPEWNIYTVMYVEDPDGNEYTGNLKKMEYAGPGFVSPYAALWWRIYYKNNPRPPKDWRRVDISQRKRRKRKSRR